jgi:hypothetical protein
MLVIVPQSKIKTAIEEEVSKKKQQYQSTLDTNKEETKIELKKQLEQLHNKLKDFVVPFEDSANLTFDIGKIAQEQRLGSFSIKAGGHGAISEIPNCNYIAESSLDISLTGQFNEFVVFLNTLERHKPVIFVDEFTITRSKIQDRLEHRANLNVSVFIKK